MTTFAVLMTVHNRRDKTLRCLERLFEQILPQDCLFEVFMTDDACTDGTPEAVLARYPQVTIVKGDGTLFWNRGMIAAWQAAVRKADYDYYFWLNDDTYLLSGALQSMLEEARERPNTVIVGATHSEGADELTYSGVKSDRPLLPNGELQICETFNGNIVLVPRFIYKQIGILDSKYIHAMGDVDYGWMVTRSGNKNFVSREFRGICNANSNKPQWMQPAVPFRERWKNFHSPLGYSQPGLMFHYNRKNFGLFRAVRVWTTNHILVCLPWLK